MSKKITAVIALVLSLILAASCPLQAFAAASSTEYVSELKIAYGKNIGAAKKWLTDNGYTPIDADLNEDADNLISSSRAVCLGYKTTNNADEAITDMKVMNMKGNYSFQAYEMILKDQAEQIGIFVSRLISSLSEYRENYAKGLYKAKTAHDMLDKILDDDTGKTMGELLLSETVQEMDSAAYEALSDEEKANHADMVTILMQGNSSATLAIEQYLCIASDTGGDTFVDRLEQIGCYDDFETAYSLEKGITNVTKLNKTLAAEYDDSAKAVARGLEDFRDLLALYTESDISGDEDEEAVNAYFDEVGEDNYALWCNARNMYLSLSDVTYEDGTLYDFFTSEDYDLEDEDRYMLYPLIASLSGGQRACAEYVSLAQLFECGLTGDDGWETNYEKISQDVIGESPVVSAYAGVNREIFEGGVALTNAAKQLNDSSTSSFADDSVMNSFSSTTYLFLTGFAVAAITSFTLKMASAATRSQMTQLIKANFREWDYASLADELMAELDESVKMVQVPVMDYKAEEITGRILRGTFDEAEEEIITRSYCNTNTLKPMADRVNVLNCIGNVLCIAMLIFALLSLGSAWMDIYDYYHTEKTPIPKYMVDEFIGKDRQGTYTYYSVVTCNRAEGGFVDDKSRILEDFGDLNGDVGKEWLALYVTKDASAGSPVRPEFVCQKGKNTAGRSVPLTMFGEKSAVNLVDEKYVYNDEFGGIYLFYSGGEAPVASTVSSTGITAIIVVAAAAVILIPVLLVLRKKKAAKQA